MKSVAEKVQITSAGIKNSLKRYDPLQALGEYVWNGFDANASEVHITINLNPISGTSSIYVADNGDGIARENLDLKFKPFFQSEKIYDPGIKHSATHGKNGIGRLTFFTFSNFATWKTIYKKDNDKYAYQLSISATTLDDYDPSEESLTTNNVGTTVIFTEITTTEITEDTVMAYLIREFCWFLELNKNRAYSIYVNDKKLDYSAQIVSTESQSYFYDQESIYFDVRYVCWKHKVSDFSKYYYIKSDGVELAKENTTLNNKGDRFYHSVYIQSALFDGFDLGQLDMEQTSMANFQNKKSPAYNFVMDKVDERLREIRRPFIKKSISGVIERLEIETAFPNYDPKNIIDQYKKDQLEELIASLYIAQPKLFTSSMNKEQKKTFIRLLDLIMDSGEINSLFHILTEILEMDEQERKDLSEILKYTKMSNITKTIKLLKDRYQAVRDLKELVYNPDLNANEVNHLQEYIENHYWLFGEQYNLVTAAEPNFEEALRRHLSYLHKEYEDISIEHPDKLKQMDIFAVRQDVAHNSYNNIVVELKHPNINIGETQLSQVKKYMNVILNTKEFNADNMTWEFYLIGNKFMTDGFIEGELESNKNHGEPFLVHKLPRYKIYVMRWSELFADFEMRHSHLNKKLQIEQSQLQKQYISANEVIEAQASNSAIAPSEMPHSKQNIY